MTPGDLPAARELWSEAEGVDVAEGDSVAELTRYLERNPGLSTVAADENGRVIGAVLCGHDGRRGFVYHLAVAKVWRGRGVARAMMGRCREGLKQQGLVRALLLVAEDNVGGQHFWRREGWDEMPYARPMGLDL